MNNRSLQEWLKEGTELYDTAVTEYRELEGQLAGLQEQLMTKLTEVNHVAKIIGKPPLERMMPAEDETALVQEMKPAENGTTSMNGAAEKAVEVAVEVVDPGQAAPYTLSSIARALTGKPTRR
ncbi:MAG: hypothetical protein FWD61_01755 [Phycisphaerales bacterium]|nr:hypothetical protein [Phycisphaerales bacterium]